MSVRFESGRPAMGLVVSIFLLAGVCLPGGASAITWPEVVTLARGQTVDWCMGADSPRADDFVKGYLTPRLSELYGIVLRRIPACGMSEAVAALRAQKQAGLPEDGSVDLLWIQGDQFRSAKNEGVLFGPLTDGLPNRKLVDWSKPSVSRDFGEPVDSLASPWGMRQMVMVHDEKRTPQPPSTMADLLDWIREHPGRFAYPAPPDAAGSAFVRQVFYHVGGGAAPWQGPFDASRFETAAADCYKLLREIAPFLWHEGRTYPESATRLDTLFADREVDFSVNLQPAAASRNIAAGRYPDSVRTLVFKEGTIGGAHFVAIPFNAAHKAGAMVVANFLLSPEAQLEMADPQVWGELAVIDPSRLDTTWREKFRRLQRGIATLPDSVLESHRLPEPASEIALRLESEWQAQVPGQR